MLMSTATLPTLILTWIESEISTWNDGSHLWSVPVSGWVSVPIPEGTHSSSQAASPGQIRHRGKKHYTAK